MQSASKVYREIDACLAAGSNEECEALIAKARADGVTGPRIDQREQTIAMRKGQFGRALALGRRRLADGDTSPKLPFAVMRLHLELGDIPAAEAHLNDYGRGEEDAATLMMKLLLAEAKMQDAELQRLAAQFYDKFGESHEWSKLVSERLRQLPATRQDLHKRMPVTQTPESGWVVPSDEELRRPLVVDSPDSDVVESVDTGSRTVVVVFTGLADRIMFPIPVFDRFLAALNLTTVYVKDFSRLLYWNGVVGLGGKSGMREKLLELRGDGQRELVFIGSSGGGYGAIRWGLEVGARKVIGFSTPTTVRADFGRVTGDERAKILIRRVQNAVPLPEQDLAGLSRAKSGTTSIDLLYGADNRIDSLHARNLEGIAGVSLHPLEGVQDHSILLPLVKAENFTDRLANLIGVD